MFAIGSISVLSVTYHFAAEYTPKIGESITTGFINMLSSLLGFINSSVISYELLRQEQNIKQDVPDP